MRSSAFQSSHQSQAAHLEAQTLLFFFALHCFSAPVKSLPLLAFSRHILHFMTCRMRPTLKLETTFSKPLIPPRVHLRLQPSFQNVVIKFRKVGLFFQVFANLAQFHRFDAKDMKIFSFQVHPISRSLSRKIRQYLECRA